MTEFVHIITASQALLPDPCPRCLWWQTTDSRSREEHGADARSQERRLEWMETVESSWGTVGMVLQDDGSTLAGVQFAPVRELPRVTLLPAGPPPDEAVLIYCLRGRLDRSAFEPSRLLHRSLSHLRKRDVPEVYAFARPLGSRDLCGLRNLCGLEFLQAHGFHVVRGGGDAFLMRLDLRGLLPSVVEAAGALRWFRQAAATPSPATFGR